MLVELLSGLPKEIIVLIIAALPVIELRGAIPIGITLGIPPIESALLSFIGSMIPVPFLLFAIRPVINFIRKIKSFDKLLDRLEKKSLSKGHKVQKYGAWGLVLFVGIPLPGTGIWTGALIATLLDIRFKWAFPAILIGNLLAAVMILGLSHFGMMVLGIY